MASGQSRRGVSDYDEVANETVDPGSGDADGDGLTVGFEEQVSLTNSNDADSDDDGLGDGAELTSLLLRRIRGESREVGGS